MRYQWIGFPSKQVIGEAFGKCIGGIYSSLDAEKQKNIDQLQQEISKYFHLKICKIGDIAPHVSKISAKFIKDTNIQDKDVLSALIRTGVISPKIFYVPSVMRVEMPTQEAFFKEENILFFEEEEEEIDDLPIEWGSVKSFSSKKAFERYLDDTFSQESASSAHPELLHKVRQHFCSLMQVEIVPARQIMGGFSPVKEKVLQQINTEMWLRKKVVESYIASGAYGSVFKTKKQAGASTSVVKIIRGERHAVYTRLAVKKLSQLKSLRGSYPPQLTQLLSSSIGVDFSALELSDGGRDLVALYQGKQGVFQYAEFRSFVQDVFCGLAWLHRARFVHGDIKPANITQKRNRYMIVDLDQIQTLREAAKKNRLSGTVEYRSVEQIMQVGTTPKSDVFSAALVLLFLLRGFDPYFVPEKLRRALNQSASSAKKHQTEHLRLLGEVFRANHFTFFGNCSTSQGGKLTKLPPSPKDSSRSWTAFSGSTKEKTEIAQFVQRLLTLDLAERPSAQEIFEEYQKID